MRHDNLPVWHWALVLALLGGTGCLALAQQPDAGTKGGEAKGAGACKNQVSVTVSRRAARPALEARPEANQ